MNNDGSKPKCCEIWMCYLPENSGSIQHGIRPVFILSNDKNNTYSTTLNVLPLTTKMNKRKLPVHVELWNCGRYGLKKPSTILIEQIMTVNTEWLRFKIGEINDRDVLHRIAKAMEIQFPIQQMAV